MRTRLNLLFLSVALMMSAASPAPGQWVICTGTTTDNCTAGKVGIGDPAPAMLLDVLGNANNAQRMRITNSHSGNGAFASLNLVNDVGNTGAFFINSSTNTSYGGSAGTLTLDNASNNAVAFATNDTVRMWVDRTGSVGIGTTAPALLFETKAAAAGLPASSGTAQTGIMRLSQGAGLGVVDFGFGGIGYGWIQATNSGNLGTTYGLSLSPNGGNVGIGKAPSTYTLDVNGTIHATSIVGAVYQDFAEWAPATMEMSPGTVVVLNRDRNNEVMPSASAYDTAVAGVVSANPGIILGEASPSKEMIATTGRVKVHVDSSRGPIRVGDLLVTSDKLGVAMRSEPIDVAGVKIHRPGTLIGKALEPLPKGQGEILVLLSLQ